MEQEPTLETRRDALFLETRNLIEKIQERGNTEKPRFAETWQLFRDEFEKSVTNYTVRYNAASNKDPSRQKEVIVRADSRGLLNVHVLDIADNSQISCLVDPSKPKMIVGKDTALSNEDSMAFLEQQLQEIKGLEFPQSEQA